VPLRHICWPLLAVVAGTAIGLKIGLPLKRDVLAALRKVSKAAK